MPLTVVILAAGQGKRMHSDLPKVLQPLAGRPMLAHVLATAQALGPAAIHVVYGHGGDQVHAAFEGEDIVWCHQTEQLGTGHATQQGIADIPNEHTVLILCGDVPLVRAEALEQLRDAVPDGGIALATATVADPTGYGRIVRDPAGSIVRIVEQRDAAGDELAIDEINTGLLACNVRDLRHWLSGLDNGNAQGEYYLTDIIALAVAEGQSVAGVLMDPADDVLGINNKLQLANAERAYQYRQACDLMDQGVTLVDPRRLDIRGTLSVGRDVFIDVGVVFLGKVALGDGTWIGPYSVIADSTLGRGSKVHAHTVIEGAEVESDCELGPFARIRPGSAFAAGVKVGNFVETKNSHVAEGTKINHLSYIGDADLGHTVNIGAGTITCNYDGANKHRTRIGDNAFIGSGTMLVAPIVVGEASTVGAGSTLSRNAPSGKLTLTRPKQITVDGWQRPIKSKS